MTRFFSFISVALTLCLAQCDVGEIVDGPDFARISNHSNVEIYGFVKGGEYTDTVIPERIGYTFHAKPHELVTFSVSFDTREEYMQKNPVIQVFIADYDAMRRDKNYPQVNNKDYFLKRYELTREWLEEHNWIIDYP